MEEIVTIPTPAELRAEAEVRHREALQDAYRLVASRLREKWLPGTALRISIADLKLSNTALTELIRRLRVIGWMARESGYWLVIEEEPQVVARDPE